MERRQEHFLDLCDSGRWRHYYTEAEFLDEMRKVLRVRDQWAALAGVPPDGEELPQDYASGPPPRPPRPLSAEAAAPWPD